MKWISPKFAVVSVGAALALGACASIPTGPSVLVLPGNGKSFEQFQTDDAVCRQWSAQQTGTTTERTSSQSTISGAAIGTAVGAAAGAAIGASRTDAAGTSVQHRYNIAYMQCMYAKGNQIPVSR